MKIDEKGLLRAVRFGNLIINPISYNPISGALKIKTTIEFNIIFDGANHMLTKSEKERLINNSLSKERLLYLIKQNQIYLEVKHKLINILKFNIDLEQTDLSKLLDDNTQSNYLTEFKILETTSFDKSIHIIKDINSIFIIFTNNKYSPHNTTKRVILKQSKKKTRSLQGSCAPP